MTTSTGTPSVSNAASRHGKRLQNVLPSIAGVTGMVVESDSGRRSAKASCAFEPGGTFDLQAATVVGLSEYQLRR